MAASCSASQNQSQNQNRHRSPTTSAPEDRAALLRARAHAFCQALVAGQEPRELLREFFIRDPSGGNGRGGGDGWRDDGGDGQRRPPPPTIREHGPSWAATRLPFLSRDFVGTEACAGYFDLLSRSLRMQLREDSFPSSPAGYSGGGGGSGEEEGEEGEGAENDGFAVDVEKNVVSVVGTGTFESTATGRSWDETFAYVLSGWDEEGRLGRWDIWADPLSAYAAVSAEDIDGWKAGEHRPLISVQQHLRE
ncbi:hypothetical protein BX600DRAFT_512060 [Xylariales sp. PMI_506]|nr:hypothetical protein BX600DRAFT_512060 [Xylariales sp. PMI_506]